MTEELKELGLQAGHRRVGRLMRQNNISMIRTRKYKVTTDSNHKFNIAANLLKQGFMAKRALDMAVALRKPPEGCIHHSGRGSQYCSHDYQKRLRELDFKISMSGKGNCYDNAAMETFFKTIKAELIWRHTWQTRRQAEIAIFEYINGFYNPRRKHSALDWKSPLALDKLLLK